MYEQWIEDQNERYQSARNQSILIGSFFNPEAAKKMLGIDSTKIQSSDKDFETTWTEMVQSQPSRRKRKRLMNG